MSDIKTVTEVAVTELKKFVNGDWNDERGEVLVLGEGKLEQDLHVRSADHSTKTVEKGTTVYDIVFHMGYSELNFRETEETDGTRWGYVFPYKFTQGGVLFTNAPCGMWINTG